MSEIDDLVNNLRRNAQGARQAQLRFAECVAVDWQAKTMTARGTADGIGYFDVRLGLMGMYTRPTEGAVCLLGIIDGQEVAAILIAADQVEEIVFDKGKNGGLVVSSKAADRLNAVESDVNNLKAVLANWVPTPQDGGLSLKTAAASWAGQQLRTTVATDLENEKIKH